MKGKKLLAVLLAALMTASSVSITAFAEDENSEQPKAVENTNENVEQSNEENDIVLFGAEAPGVNTYAVQIGEDGYDSLDEAMNSLSERTGDIVIKLSGTVSYEYNAHKDFTKSYTGGTITFEGIGENRSTVLNLYGKDSDATPIENDTKLIFRNLTINKTNNEDDGSAAWNRHAINFEGGVEFEDVNVNTEVAVGDASTFTNVNFTEANAQYCLWIKSSASGKIVVDGCSFTATSGGRGIKVADQYAGNNSKTVSLTVKNSTFNTAKKAAVLVSNVKGADITAYGNDISNVSEDNANLVWIDDGENDQEVSYSESINKIIVRDENGKIVNAVRVENGNVVTKTVVATVNDLECANLQNAVDLAKDNDEIKLVSDIVIEPDDATLIAGLGRFCHIDGKKITIDLNGKQISMSESFDTLSTYPSYTMVDIFVTSNSADVTFTGDGKVVAKSYYVNSKELETRIIVPNGSSNIIIENGEYVGDEGIVNISYKNGTNVSTCTVNGGTFKVQNNEKPENMFRFSGTSVSDGAYINFKGGTFIGINPNDMAKTAGISAKVAPGYVPTADTDGNYTVAKATSGVASAVVDGETLYFATLQEAIENADNNSTIKLMNDIVVTQNDLDNQDVGNKTYHTWIRVKDKTIILDFDNHNITIANDVKQYNNTKREQWVRLFRLNANSNLTVTGNGSVSANTMSEGGYGTCCFNLGNSATLTVENGTFMTSGEVIYSQAQSGYEAYIYINGGKFGNYENDSTYIWNVSTGLNSNHFTVIGGTFIDADPRYMNDGNLVADNYLVTRKGNEYTIISNENIVATITTANNRVYSYTSLADAIANANDGDTVKLLADANGDGAVIEKDITIDLNGKTYTLSGRAVGSSNTQTNAFQLLADNVTFKNGTLTTSESVTCHNNTDGNYTAKANMLIQNYSNLTLDGVTLDGTNLRDTGYTLSNCKGNVEIKNSKINTNGKTFAFDVDNSRGTNQSVTVTNSEIDGFVEISGNDGKDAKLVSGTNEYKENDTYVQSGDKFIKAEKRSIEISANKAEVEMDDIVTISVTLNGNNLANVVYDLAYDATKFEFISASTETTANNGSLSEMLYKDDGTCYENGKAVATYTFKALGQTENVTADFVISNTAAATYLESIDATNIKTTSNEKVSVAINLKNYEVTVNVDGNAVSEDTLNVPYTNEGHTFSVTATPTANVSYKVNGGDETDSVSVSERGTYTIEYTITPTTGYAKVTGTFTLVIGDPKYVVEVNLTGAENRDYVSGKKIVLVYTNTDGLAFNYGDDLMIDVTERGYKYNGTDEYSHVYAFVTDAIESSDAEVTVEDYSKNISCVIPSPAELVKLTYSMDLNFDDNLNVQDITTAYGIYNVNADYFKNVKYQKNILRADTDGNKCVNNDDANTVVDAVKNK